MQNPKSAENLQKPAGCTAECLTATLKAILQILTKALCIKLKIKL